MRSRPRTAPSLWFVCPGCPADDNDWPASAFRAWTAASRRGRPQYPICDACLFARYPRVYYSCQACGGLMYYHSRHPHRRTGTCSSCLRQRQAARTAAPSITLS